MKYYLKIHFGQVESGARYANGIPVTPNSLTSVSAYVQQVGHDCVCYSMFA